jgi:hypothetical protein
MERYRGRLVGIISHIWRHFVRAAAAATRHRITSKTAILATIKLCVMQAAGAVEAVVVVVVVAVAVVGKFY